MLYIDDRLENIESGRSRGWQVILQEHVAFHIKARPYVFDCKYEEPFWSDVHLRVSEAFRERGILAPTALVRFGERISQ